MKPTTKTATKPATTPGTTSAPTTTPAAARTGTLQTRDIPIADIHFRQGKDNMRQDFDAQKLTDLTESMREHGQLQAILVAPRPEGGGYWYIAGERRIRAAKALGWTHIRADIVTDDVNLGVEENFKRDDIKHWERVLYVVSQRQAGVSNKDLAKRMGLSEQVISTDYGIGTKLAPDIFAAWKAHPAASKIALEIYNKPADEQRRLWEAYLKGETPDRKKSTSSGSGDGDSKGGAAGPGKKTLDALYVDVCAAVGVVGDGAVADFLAGARWWAEYEGGIVSADTLPEEVATVIKRVRDARATKPATLTDKRKAATKAEAVKPADKS